MDSFVKSVIADVRYQVEFFNVKKIVTAYIGGGTPSALGWRRISILLDALKSLPAFTPKEFTIEANPESADGEFLSACREGGINRISLGVQSFHAPSRCDVNRQGQAKMIEERLALVSHFFPEVFSADLITGLPRQTEKIVVQDVSRLLAFKPTHVSLYSLSVEGGTPLEQKLKTKSVILPDRNKADSLWLAGRNALEEAGFEHYEVSNFALPQKRCLHNLRYWRMENWLGSGPSASGTVIDEKNGTARRFTFASDVGAYIKSPSIRMAACEELDRAELMKECILMGFRYCEGPDTEKFRRRFGCGVEDCIGQTIDRWRSRGFFNGNVPAKKLMLFLNSFLSEAFIEIDEYYAH